jgi:hypothetical protein
MTTATATKKPKARKAKTAALKAEGKATKSAKKESGTREDPRASILLAYLVKNPAATTDDMATALNGKADPMSDSALILIRRGWRQSVRALGQAGLLTKAIDLG